MPLVRYLLLTAVFVSACSDAKIGDVPEGEEPDAPPLVAQDAGIDARPSDAGTLCEPGVTQLLANPGFDEGAATGWSQSGGTLILSAGQLPVTVQSGSHAARLLSDNGADQVLSQPVAVPAYTSTLELLAYRCWVTSDTSGTDDRVSIELLDDGGAVVETLATITNADAGSGCNWSSYVLASPAPHPGEMLTFRFHGTTDSSVFTTLYFDTLELNATVTCQ